MEVALINANISYFSSIYISAFESGYSSFCPHLKQRIDWQLIAGEVRENAGDKKDIFSNYQDLRSPGLDIPPTCWRVSLQSPVWTMEMLEMSPIDRNNHLASDTPELANFTDNFNLQLTPLFIFGYCLIQYKSAFDWEGSGKNSGG